MNISPIKSLLAKHNSQPRRSILPGLLLVALALAVIASGALAAGGNLVKNGSFEKDSNGDGLPNGWVYGQNIAPGDKRVCNQGHSGACSFKIVGDGTSKALYQDITRIGAIGDSYQLTFWLRGKNIPDGGDLIIEFYIFHGDGVSEDVVQQVVPSGTTAWQKYVLNLTATESYGLLSVDIFDQSGPSGKAWFDSVKVVPSP